MNPSLSDRVANNPVALWAVIAGAIVGAASFLTGWGNGMDWRIALGAGLGEFAVVGLGATVARAQAWGPRTVDGIVDAHAVIAAAEADSGA